MKENSIFDSPTRTVCDNLEMAGGMAKAFARRSSLFDRNEHDRSVNANRGRGRTRTRKAFVMTTVSRGTGRTTTYEL